MIDVEVQCPAQAHLAVPEQTPITLVSRHTESMRGLINAMRACQRALHDYTLSHGNAAARRGWVVLPDGTRVPSHACNLEFWEGLRPERDPERLARMAPDAPGRDPYAYACRELHATVARLAKAHTS